MKKDQDKTKEQLITELKEMRQRVVELEASEVEHKQAETIPSAAEENYLRMFELFPIGITVLDMKGVILYCNSAVYNEGGYAEGEFTGKHFSKIASVRLKDIPKFIRVFNSVVRGKIPKPFEAIYQRKDGTTGWTELHIGLTKVGGKRRILVIQHDITERRQAEEALQESERHYRLLAENAKDAIWTVDMNMRPTYMSPSITYLLGYTVEEAMAKPMEAVYTPASFEIAMKVLAEELAIENMEQKDLSRSRTVELELNRKDGSIVPVEGNFSFIRGPDGRPVGILAIARDITERKKAIEQLEESHRFIERVTSTNPAVIYVFDLIKQQNIYASHSLANVLGLTPEEFKAMGDNVLGLLIHPDDLGPFMKYLDTLSKDRDDKLYKYEYRMKHKSGDWVWILNNDMIFTRDTEGKPLQTIGVALDITDRKQAEEREKELQKELNLASRLASVGQMAAGIAHEINNPLTGVVGFSDLLMKKDIPEDIRKDIKIIYDGAQRVAGITSRMLAYARQYNPEQTTVDINDIIKTTLAMRAYEMESSNIKVTTQLASDMPLTFADAGQLQQVFLNIVLNAEIEMIKAHGKGSLSVKTERIDNTIRVSFKDDGPGILKKNLERIFDPFFTTREVGQGAGLGLSVSHGIVTQHGGKLYAQSRLGKGTTFFVELPIITKAEQLKFAEPTAGEVKRVSAARILVVDDDPIVQQFLNEILTEEGHEVEIIDNGNDALERLESENYDLILLDIKLPGISGIDLYNQLQKKAKSLARRVLFITGDTMSKSTKAFFSKTRVPYITKPFNTEQLEKDIDHILSQQS